MDYHTDVNQHYFAQVQTRVRHYMCTGLCCRGQTAGAQGMMVAPFSSSLLLFQAESCSACPGSAVVRSILTGRNCSGLDRTGRDRTGLSVYNFAAPMLLSFMLCCLLFAARRKEGKPRRRNQQIVASFFDSPSSSRALHDYFTFLLSVLSA